MQHTIDTNTSTDTPYAKYRDIVTNAGYAPSTLELLTWLLDVAEQHGWSLNTIASKVGVSYKPIHGVLTATYGASPDNILRRITLFRERHESSKLVAEIPFVETSIARRIWRSIDYARSYSRVVSIIGESHYGKTWAIEEYQRRKQAQGDDSVIIIRMPVSPSPHRVCLDLCEAMGISRNLSYAKANYQLRQKLTARHTVIVDECHQATDAAIRGWTTIEMIRELRDTTRCSLVLVGTNVWGRALTGEIVKSWGTRLDQTLKRGITVQIPSRLLYEDMRLIWQACGLPDPDSSTPAGQAILATVEDIIDRQGLGIYTDKLCTASTAAANIGKPLSWEAFMATHKQLEDFAIGAC